MLGGQIGRFFATLFYVGEIAASHDDIVGGLAFVACGGAQMGLNGVGTAHRP